MGVVTKIRVGGCKIMDHLFRKNHQSHPREMRSIIVVANSISRNYSHSLFRVHVPDNRIGAAGATALVEGLKEMRELKTLNLEREFRVVVISRCGDSGTEMV